jgi:lauroyl/myristoyl acyltransferase
VVRRFLDAIGSTADVEEALCQSLVCGRFVAWRLMALSRAHDKCANKWVHIDGARHVEDTYRRNRRLIVIGAHQGLARFSPQILSRMGYQVHLTPAGIFYDGIDFPEWKEVTIEVLQKSRFFAKDIFVALKAIKAGKIFYLMADGRRGKAVLELPFLGRLRGFPKSYAELALSHNADVIPVFTRIEPSGHIKVIFCPPLDKGTEEMAGEERVSMMVRQYVSLLSDEYRRDPASVHLRFMSRFLDDPPSKNSGD